MGVFKTCIKGVPKFYSLKMLMKRRYRKFVTILYSKCAEYLKKFKIFSIMLKTSLKLVLDVFFA